VRTGGGGRLFAGLWSDSRIVNLGTIGSGQSLGGRVNSRRQIAALHRSSRMTWDGDLGDRAAVWQRGVFIDINRLIPTQPANNGWDYLESAADLAEHGKIVGYGKYTRTDASWSHKQFGFLLTPPTFLLEENPSLSVNNVFSFTVVGDSGLVCTVEAATDLVAANWSTLGTVTLQNGTAVFTDSSSSSYTARFYRVSSGSQTSGDVVGFTIKQIPVGQSMVADPFEGTDNRVQALFDPAPAGTIVYKWDESTQSFRTNFKDDLGGQITWSSYLMTLYPGEGAIVRAPSLFTVKWTGRLRQNALSRIVSSQQMIHSSIAALSGLVGTTLAFPVAHGDSVSRMTGTDGSYTTYTYSNGAWSPSQPTISLGESFWSNKAKAVVWRQNYSAW